MGTCRSGTCSPSYKALPIHRKTSVINKNKRVKKNTISTPKLHQMPNDLPHFTIKCLPKDFPIKQLTPLKCSKYDFDPSKSHSLSIFRFRYKLSSKHVLDHHWYCKLNYCPFHHRY